MTKLSVSIMLFDDARLLFSSIQWETMIEQVTSSFFGLICHQDPHILIGVNHKLVQLSNRDNVIGQPIFSLGLMKGYVYHKDIEQHITTFPLMLSVPLSEYVTPTLMYRHELISKDFVPSTLENPRSTFALGCEVNLVKPSPEKWTPKIGLSIGTFNSLTGGEGDRGLILNFGVSIDSPLRSR